MEIQNTAKGYRSGIKLEKLREVERDKENSKP